MGKKLGHGKCLPLLKEKVSVMPFAQLVFGLQNGSNSLGLTLPKQY